jgi:uncharacterized protein (TIGR02611 family)
MLNKSYNTYVKRSTKNFRRFIVSIVAFPLLALGIVFIPIPGPGFLLCFLALLLLSLEFDWANTYLQKIKQEFKKIYAAAKARADKIEQLGDRPKKSKR